MLGLSLAPFAPFTVTLNHSLDYVVKLHSSFSVRVGGRAGGRMGGGPIEGARYEDLIYFLRGNGAKWYEMERGVADKVRESLPQRSLYPSVFCFQFYWQFLSALERVVADHRGHVTGFLIPMQAFIRHGVPADMSAPNTNLYVATCVRFGESTCLPGCAAMLVPGPSRGMGVEDGGALVCVTHPLHRQVLVER